MLPSIYIRTNATIRMQISRAAPISTETVVQMWSRIRLGSITGLLVLDRYDVVQVLRVLQFDRQNMTSGNIILHGEDTLLVVKGSCERVLEIADKDTVPANFLDVAQQCASAQQYVMAMAVRKLDSSLDIEYVVQHRFSFRIRLF